MDEQSIVLDEDIRLRLVALVRLHGESSVGSMLQVGRETLARLLAGMTVRRGTLALVERQLGQFEQLASAVAQREGCR